MIEEFSAGGVIFKYDDTGSPKVLLCYQKKLSGNKSYCLPKGHIENGETIERAAMREVEEETGVVAKIVTYLSDISYIFTEKGVKRKKNVSFFLMEALAVNFKPNEETEEIVWCNEKEALLLDRYPSEQEIIEKAFRTLEQLK